MEKQKLEMNNLNEIDNAKIRDVGIKKLSVITPVYNVEHLKENLEAMLSELRKLGVDFELIAVDDGSTNGCYFDASGLKDRHLKLIRYEKNRGKGYALRYGFKLSSGDYILFIDSDLDIPPLQISNFIWRIKGYDILIASKRNYESKIHYPYIRRIFSFSYQTFVRLLFGLTVTDTQVGLKMFKREVLENVFKKATVDRYATDLEILVLAHRAGFIINEGPVIIDYKFGGSVGFKAVFRMFGDTLKLFYKLNIIKLNLKRS